VRPSSAHSRVTACCVGLTGPPASARAAVDEDRFGGLTACDTRRELYGAGQRAVLTHSPELHEEQARGFADTTLAKAGRTLDELAATLARGKTRRRRTKPPPRSLPPTGPSPRPSPRSGR